MATATQLLQPSFTSDRLLPGALAGIAGGVVFGLMITMGGMMPMIASLVGSSDIGVGWVVHLVISAVFGAIFAIAVARPPFVAGIGLGIVWGIILWAVAAMVVMRSLLGAPIAFDPGAVQSLSGHVVYGVVLGFVYAALPEGLSLGAGRGQRA